jgi:hypothetical protein
MILPLRVHFMHSWTVNEELFWPVYYLPCRQTGTPNFITVVPKFAIGYDHPTPILITQIPRIHVNIIVSFFLGLPRGQFLRDFSEKVLSLILVSPN